ncbi:hypothetical protein [Soonwooa sp.]|uniref:hypothetical protein n=1 Tax=Soonwooa sp. TaxID=1938592 RepID=UPI0026299823|nr:hypothetical protein [Soonwooa sp.]
MAKNIKAIKCPQCGSTKATELKPDYYRCNSCGTEFFLDSDDININHNYNYPNNKPQVDSKKVGLIFGGMVILFVILPIFINLFTSSKKNSYGAYSSSTKDSKEAQYSWNNSSDALFVDAKGDPYFVVVGSLYDDAADYQERDVKNAYLVLYDGKTSEKKMAKDLGSFKFESSSDVELRIFDDKNLYFILNKKRIFRLNAKDLSVEELTDTYVKNNNDISVGLAKVEFLYSNYGSGFNVVTNDGRNLVFMPFINKTYDKNQSYKAENAKLPQPNLETAFAFSSPSTEYPNEKLELVKYKYEYQMGYMRDKPRFEWRKDYGGSGIFTDRDPYTKYFAYKGDGRLVSFIDLTPGRTYFSPTLVAFSTTEVLIGIKPTPGEDEKYQLQILNPDNGTILKTVDLPTKYLKENGYILKDGYFFEGNDAYFIDKNGKIVNTIKGTYDLKLKDLN